MDIIQTIMTGGTTISNDEENCLLSPSIKCDDSINYLLYSSKILSGEDNYNEYMTKYNKDLQIDPQHDYLIELPNKECNITTDKIRECSELVIEEPDHIKNVITEESYYLENYINEPELLQDFITNEPNFFKHFLYEFKNLFEGLQFLSNKNIAHHNINPKNIIFNQQTKKLKFINFGKSENKNTIINTFKQNKFHKYQLKIYYPFICFFMNYQNYIMYKNLTDEENEDFINYLNHKFFNESYTPARHNRNFRLKEQFKNIDSINELKKYKQYIKTNYDKNFFKITLSSFKNNYLKRNQSYSTFLKYIINAIDIYGLSLTTLHFFKSVKNKYPIEQFNHLSSFLNNMINNSPSPNVEKTCIAEKAFIYFRRNYYFILDLLKKKGTQPNNNRLNNGAVEDSQYKLLPKNISTYHGNIDKQYINHNGKLMRIFKRSDIFKNLRNLSSHNRAIIKKIIDDDDRQDTLNILIDKEAYYKIKYNVYCTNNKEVNPYTKKCVPKCPEDHVRNFNDTNFTCTRKNKNKKNKSERKSRGENKRKSKKNRDKTCPSGYERNPFTKECTRKCLPGYIRNLKFNCVAEKDVL